MQLQLLIMVRCVSTHKSSENFTTQKKYPSLKYSYTFQAMLYTMSYSCTGLKTYVNAYGRASSKLLIVPRASRNESYSFMYGPAGSPGNYPCISCGLLRKSRVVIDAGAHFHASLTVYYTHSESFWLDLHPLLAVMEKPRSIYWDPHV